MSRPRTLTPKYRLHKSTGQAVVRIDGKDFYLGKHGTPGSKERYAALMAEYLTVRKVPQLEHEDTGPSVDEVIADYWQHLEQDGRYLKNGKPTSEREWIKDSLKPLSRVFGESSRMALSRISSPAPSGRRCLAKNLYTASRLKRL